jgi:hypothetical protein
MNISVAAHRGRIALWSLVAFMAFTGVLGRYLLPEDVFLRGVAVTSPKFAEQQLVLFQHPWTEALHRLFGVLLLVIGMLQFNPQLRRNNPQLHRWTGRTFLALASVVSVTSLMMAIFYPFAGLPEVVFVVFVASLLLFLLGKGWTHARARRFALHREWMIRSVGLVFFIAVMRIYTTPLNLLTDLPEPEAFISAGWMSIITVLAVAEWWINKTRQHLGALPAAVQQPVAAAAAAPPA